MGIPALVPFRDRIRWNSRPAVLLAQARTRPWGSALGCIVMLAALATVTLHGEYGHGVAPLVAATLSIAVGWIAWRKRPLQPGMTDTPAGSSVGHKRNVAVRAVESSR